MKAQIEKGEAFDLAVLTVAGIDDLIKQGDISANVNMRPGDVLVIPESFF